MFLRIQNSARQLKYFSIKNRNIFPFLRTESVVIQLVSQAASQSGEDKHILIIEMKTRYIMIDSWK